RLEVARAEQKHRAVKLRELRARPIRVLCDDPVEERLGLGPLGWRLQGELRREQERVRGLRVPGVPSDELEEFAPRLVVLVLPERRPRDAEPGRASERMARELDERRAPPRAR